MFFDIHLELIDPPETTTGLSNVTCASINSVEYAIDFRVNLVIRHSIENCWPLKMNEHIVGVCKTDAHIVPYCNQSTNKSVIDANFF